MTTPLDKKLYAQVVAEAKGRFRVWPSAYASGWVVRRYKERGGRYKDGGGDKGLARWFQEKWVNVCELPRLVPCGRPTSSMRDYPYCRPWKRVNAKTPTTARELSPQERKERCARKKSNPTRKVLV
jgi:hypothetical protein